MSNESHHHHDGRRVEDFRLITGAGRYASDWNEPGQLYGHFVRSDRAHAEIVSVDTKNAAAFPGVKQVFTGEDAVRAGYVRAPHTMQFVGKNGMKARAPDRPVLAHGKVRFVGEAVALVVADSAAAAQDAADLVEVEYRDLQSVTDPEGALAAGAPQLSDEVPGNLAWESEVGDEKAVEAAFAAAAHITQAKVISTRVAPNPMEPRACLVAYDAATESYRIHTPMQGVTTQRSQLSAYTKVPAEKLVFEAGDVGGGFGQRSGAYPEYAALMIAAKALGAPVKWTGTRTEGLLTDTHGRNMIAHGQLALDKDGKFLAMRIDWIVDLGAYLSPGAQGHIRNTTNCMTGVYKIPALYATYRIPITNTTPIGAYRGAGRPDIAYAVESLVNQAAAEIGMDPAELRRRNFIPPSDFPYTSPTGGSYEIADLPGMLEKALELADWKGFAARRAKSKAGRQASRHRHFDRHREHRPRQRPRGRGRDPARRERHGHRIHGRQVAGTEPRDDVRADHRQRAADPAREGEDRAVRARHEVEGERDRRLAQHRRRRQRLPPRGTEARRRGQGAGGARAARRAVPGGLRERRVQVRCIGSQA